LDLNFEVTEVYRINEEFLNDPYIRLIVNRGSTRSSKTYSIIQLLIKKALETPNIKIVMLSETMPKVKDTIEEDFKDIMGDTWDVYGSYHQTKLTYTFPNGSRILLRATDNEQKIRGMKSDILFIDEVNAIPFEIYRQLASRCTGKIFVAFNPSAEFYITELVDNDKVGKVVEYVSTYIQNPFLSKDQIEEIQEFGRRDENYRRVFELGLYGSAEGLILEENKHWFLIDKLPEQRDQEVFVIDFGFTNDPNALLQCYLLGNDIFISECLYKGDMLNREIAIEIKEWNPFNVVTICDSAEPKTIAEFKRIYGLNIKGVVKEHIIESIQSLKNHNIFVTKDSLNVINELRNYAWHQKKKDKKGRAIPIDLFNHAIDGIRYISDTFFKPLSKRKGRVVRL